MENKNIQKITIACFAILAVWDIVNLLDYFTFLGLLATIGSVLVVVALLKKTPVFSAVGFGLMALQGIGSILENVGSILDGWFPLSILLVWVLNITVNILLMIISIKPQSAKSLGITAAGIAIVRLVVLIIRNLAEGYSTTATTIIWGVLFAASAMLLGLSFDSFAKEPQVIKTSTPAKVSPVVENTLQNSNVEKLLRLKELLDKGVITQEEFDEKKKELLNL